MLEARWMSWSVLLPDIMWSSMHLLTVEDKEASLVVVSMTADSWLRRDVEDFCDKPPCPSQQKVNNQTGIHQRELL